MSTTVMDTEVEFSFHGISRNRTFSGRTKAVCSFTWGVTDTRKGLCHPHPSPHASCSLLPTSTQDPEACVVPVLEASRTLHSDYCGGPGAPPHLRCSVGSHLLCKRRVSCGHP